MSQRQDCLKGTNKKKLSELSAFWKEQRRALKNKKYVK